MRLISGRLGPVYRTAIFAALSIVLLSFNLYAQKPTAKTFYDIGMENSKNAEYSEAIDAFEHAIKLKPDYAEAHFGLGNVYYSLHRYTEAIDEYKNAVEAKPEYFDAHVTLGVVSSMLSRYDEAIDAFKKAVKIKPKNAEAFYNLGNIYMEVERYKEAAGAFEKAIELRPELAEAHYNLGICYLKLREIMLNSARAEYNYLIRLDKNLAKNLSDLIKKARK